MFLQPQELAPGKGRGFSLVGTLACKVEKCADGIHVVECHLLTGTQPADVVFVEAWAGQAQRLCAPSNGDVVKLTHPIIKELGKNRFTKLEPPASFKKSPCAQELQESNIT